MNLTYWAKSVIIELQSWQDDRLQWDEKVWKMDTLIISFSQYLWTPTFLIAYIFIENIFSQCGRNLLEIKNLFNVVVV